MHYFRANENPVCWVGFCFFKFRVTSNSSFPRRRESGSSGFCHFR
ncbi:hypothetical protein NEILACOT_04722 [Neisseria lactamica ATCC 23970]|uniref:Uncharacterized protein n=1 Tax=Neisseria lactamica ATCC 23970 TaxID=546265 RepID=D0WAZ8_NEILA|nr:hypothetical protein NEILACOT_04722 [Neisseria lactamica ATCC 23970]